jgi:DNA-binding NarL/FixJ family response regulator
MKPLRILVVDDHVKVRHAIRMLLADCPEYQVCGEAVDGREAIQRSKQLNPNLVLLDISLPDMSGLEVLQTIRRDVPGCHILIVSQHDPLHLESIVLAHGADGFVSKACLSTDLARMIGTIISDQSGTEKPGRLDDFSCS